MNAQYVSTLRPGLLVSLKTGLSGNVSYSTKDLPLDTEDDGAARAKWETLRTIENPAEHEAAVKVRGKARSLITAVCSPSSFGLLCPEQDSDKLNAAMREARALIDEFNQTARVTQVTIAVLVGRIASDDVEAVRAINTEIRDLLTAMEQGLQRLDVEAVREAANKARAMAFMLSPEAEKRTRDAIAAARSVARRMVSAGETAAAELDEAVLEKIRQSRAAFIDLEEGDEIAAPVEQGRAIDLEVEDTCPPATPAAFAPSAIEFE